MIVFAGPKEDGGSSVDLVDEVLSNGERGGDRLRDERLTDAARPCELRGRSCKPVRNSPDTVWRFLLLEFRPSHRTAIGFLGFFSVFLG